MNRFKIGDYVKTINPCRSGYSVTNTWKESKNRIVQIIGLWDDRSQWQYEVRFLDKSLRHLPKLFRDDELRLATEDEAMVWLI